ncbi:Component of the mitotic exit network [Reticulomyxa filosa]|uniref:Component of the mitotic exit network n=1 Tax=Reticulomyxa filosa TaxID=46433 RepID=X6MPV9_RETFI|nr:Component of the mitotic exit network [Reticulomyxa filosa]|eukprot:ETO15135.1 Component of the mitotic exit network [Reticulomyxa filosa]
MAQASSETPTTSNGAASSSKSSNKHFKEEKKHGSQKRMALHEYSSATLGAGNMAEAVKLPKGEDSLEWLAVNVVDFFNEISLLYGIITEFCTDESCPLMSAGPKYEYLWMDGVKFKKPIKVSAPKYIDYLMSWVETQINDPQIFPIEEEKTKKGAQENVYVPELDYKLFYPTRKKKGVKFPKDFKSVCKTILKRLFRVYGHIYHSHIQKIAQLDCEAHLNTCFKHFIYFVKEFKLVDDRELAPLKDTIQAMLEKDAQKKILHVNKQTLESFCGCYLFVQFPSHELSIQQKMQQLYDGIN